MHLIILTLVLFFIATNIITEFVNRKTLSPLTNPMSSYLAGVPLAWLQDLGFGALAVALLILPLIFPFSMLEIATFYLSAVAIAGVVGTKWVIQESGNLAERALMERIHVICAGIAFAGTTLGLLLYTWPHDGLAFGAGVGAVISAALFARFAPKQTALEEKSYTALLMISLLALVR